MNSWLLVIDAKIACFFCFFTFQPTNDWSMAPPSEAQNGGVTPQLLDTSAKGQDDNRM